MPTDIRPEFARISSKPFRLFQFFCLTSFNNNLSDKFSSRTILLILTWHICIAIIILFNIGYTLCVVLPSISNSHLDFYVIIHSLEIVAALIAHVLCVIESIIKRANQIQIVSNVQCIVSDVSKKLEYNVNLTPVSRNFAQNCNATFLISGATCVLSFSLMDISSWALLGLIIYSFQLMYVRKIQVGFYVDTMVVMQEELRNVLDDIKNEMDTERRLQKLMVAQRIYSDIVKTVALINCTFSLSLVPVIFQNMLQLLSTTYWFIVIFYYFESSSGMFSEYWPLLGERIMFKHVYF